MNEYELLEEFADNLQYFMRERGINQNQLAKQVGVSRTTINRYIQLERMPTLAVLLNIRYVLNCELDDLIPTYDFITL